MSVCSPCIQACNVPLCTDEIIIGTISSLSTDVKIIVHNKTTGRKSFVSTQSDGAGVVTLVTSGLGLMADQTYELSVLLATATNLCDGETLQIGTSSATCVNFQFENIKDSGGCQITFASQTLTPKEENTQPGTDCLCITQEILDSLGCCEIESHTVAEMQALVGSFVPNRTYRITNPAGTTDPFLVKAVNADSLASKGDWLKADGKVYQMTYLLDDGIGNTDLFLSRYDSEHGNYFTRTIDNLGDCISNFPFNDANYTNCTGEDSFLSLTNQALISISRCYAKQNVSIVIDASASGGLMQVADCNFAPLSTLSISGANGGLIGCNLWQEAGVTLVASALTRCEIGSGMSISLNGVSYVSKVLYNYLSTFDTTITVVALSLQVDFTGVGYAGVVNLTAAGAAETIENIVNINFALYRFSRKFYGASGKTFTFQNGGNLAMKGGAAVTLTSEQEWIEFQSIDLGATWTHINDFIA